MVSSTLGEQQCAKEVAILLMPATDSVNGVALEVVLRLMDIESGLLTGIFK